QSRFSNIHPADYSGADGAEAVLTLDPEHRACVRLAIVLASDVIGGSESRYVVPRLIASNANPWLARDHSDLPLVVEVSVTSGPAEESAMGVQRSQRLLKIGWSFKHRRAEFDSAGVIVQMDAKNLGGVTGW